MKLLTACAVALVLLPACDKGETAKSVPVPAKGTKPTPRPSGATPPRAPSGAAAPPAVSHAPGDVPFDFPAVSTSAKKGDYVLAPSASWIAEALEKGGDKQTFIYYGGWMIEPGDKVSEIKTLPGVKSTIPNALIIPIVADGTAKPGDILLTTWQSGSGMQRAIVVDGGTPEKPKVRYLDLALDNPSGWGKKVDTLKPNTFTKLERPGQVGSTVACKVGARRTRWVVTNADGDRLLVIGFAGRMRAFKRSDCKNLPIKPALHGGDKVMVPLVGGYVEGRVQRIDASIGRVFARYKLAGKEEERAFSFTNVAAKVE